MRILVLLAALSAPISIVSQDLMQDSEFWNSVELEEKIAFLKGVYTGLGKSLEVMGKEAARQEDRDPHWVPPFVHERSAYLLREFFSDTLGFDYKTLADLLDVFYANPDNIHIDVMSALHILALHQNGHLRRANEMLLMKQREALKDR